MIGPLTAIAIFIVIWWVVLFAILPLGQGGGERERPTDGGDWGAPSTHQLKRKFLTTTWVSLAIWVVVLIVIYFGLIPLPAFPVTSTYVGVQ